MQPMRVIVARPMQYSTAPSVFSMPEGTSENDCFRRVVDLLAKENDVANPQKGDPDCDWGSPAWLMQDDEGCDLYFLTIQDIDVIYG